MCYEYQNKQQNVLKIHFLGASTVGESRVHEMGQNQLSGENCSGKIDVFDFR